MIVEVVAEITPPNIVVILINQSVAIPIGAGELSDARALCPPPEVVVAAVNETRTVKIAWQRLQGLIAEADVLYIPVAIRAVRIAGRPRM